MTSPSANPGPGSLRGVQVLVGRARHQASALSAGLKDLGAQVIEIPFLEIRPPRSYKPFDNALRRIHEYHWLILTSANGVRALAARMKQLRIPRAKLEHLKIAAIGPATQEEIEQLGLAVSVVPKRYVVEADETVAPESSRSRLQALFENARNRPDVITFASSSSVKNFVALLGGRGRRPPTDFNGIRFASIGPITSATLRELGLPVDIEAAEFTIPGLIRAIELELSR